MKKYIVGFALVVLVSALFFAKYTGDDTISSSERTPAESSTAVFGTDELFTGSKKVLSDLNNPNVFNARTCAEVVNKVTDYLFYLPANHFIPKTDAEKEQLKTKGPELLNTVFQIRVTLHEKLKQFDSRNELESNCIQKIREGFQYARFTEEYILDWLYAQKVYTFKKTPVLIDEQPSTWTNPKFKGFQLQSGDVMLIRGKSYVSAMIARIADEEGNFSHAAIVGEDKAGKKYVVEALIQHGVVVTPLEKWRQAEDSRVALFRYPDQALAKKAARYMYDLAQGALDRKQGIRYDFSMNDDDYSSMFCSEVIRVAYDKASGGKVMIPKFRSTTTKFKDHKYPRTLGVTKTSLFAPYDVEVDPRFDFIAEYRFMPLLRQVRMQDAVLQSVYSWMIEKGYDFHWDLGHSSKSYLAKLVRQFGVAKESLPKYMPVETIKTTVQFETVAAALEKNIYKKEAEYYKKNGYLPSFQDMLAINEAFRVQDCKNGKRFELPGIDRSQFHGFFYSDSKSCE
ncbi:YiiX/YebB-like N1pC/P60 family cysteine hydrolase [Bdellovibrio sp. GT3]|uniref:YiiX/YebB-like N1pC/P60 family cysteine hydrolase n=1 Tax=Bdellovibrio sp. GT3 TaxID=3136282 RepID=UPI0030F22659